MEDPNHKIPFARNLRQNQTEVEKLLWKYLRNRRLNGVKFRRQHPIGPYIVDFVSIETSIVIEVDGGQHNTELGKKYDVRRKEYLRQAGYQVLRFWDNDIMKDTDAVLEVISKALTLPSPRGRGVNGKDNL